jgi:2,3-bisphosphoglycerate-dependent phosphoglycerate mutase
VERLILARHGETDWNVRRIVNGDPAVAVPLSAAGREEARLLGETLADEAIDLCVTTLFPRTQETADIALAARAGGPVPRLVLAELGDPRYGSFEGKDLDDYRAWAWSRPSTDALPGGESRFAIVSRYAVAFRRLCERPEAGILAVCHSLPVAYALGAKDGHAPEPKTPLIANAHPYRFTRAELERVVETLEGWCASPGW